MIARYLAGVLLGFPLAAWLLRLMLAALPHRGAEWLIPALILFIPLWIALIAAAFAFRNAARAWVAFGCANAAAFALTQWIG